MKKRDECEVIDEQRKASENPDDPNLSYFTEYTSFDQVPEN